MSQLSPETRAWIDSLGSGDAPQPEDRARIRQRLALELGAAALATTTLAVATQAATSTGASATTTATSLAVGKAATSAGLFAKLALAAAVAGVVSTSAVVAVRSMQPPARRDAKTQASGKPAVQARLDERAEVVPAALAPQLEPIVEQLPASREVSRSAASATRLTKRPLPPHVQVEPTTGAQGSMPEELALLGEAQLALREGHIADALARTAEHAARFPRGALREERAAVDMLAHCAQGTATSQMLTSFLAAAPESPLKARVRDACETGL